MKAADLIGQMPSRESMSAEMPQEGMQMPQQGMPQEQM